MGHYITAVILKGDYNVKEARKMVFLMKRLSVELLKLLVKFRIC